MKDEKCTEVIILITSFAKKCLYVRLHDGPPFLLQSRGLGLFKEPYMTHLGIL
jgi:hypothetical protein